MKAMNYILMTLGLVILIVAIRDYSKETSKLETDDDITYKRNAKLNGWVNIMVGILYFSLGLFLVLELLAPENAFLYVILTSCVRSLPSSISGR